jgi:hypothetical protein
MVLSDSTTLVVSTLEAFIELLDAANLGQVESLHIGARLYRSMPRELLFAWIA